MVNICINVIRYNNQTLRHANKKIYWLFRYGAVKTDEVYDL